MNNASGGGDARLPSARALYELALEFVDRSLEAEAGLIAAFSEAAAALCEEVGPIVIDRDDDERLHLGADGILFGEVLDDDTGTWRAVESPGDVVRYYDSTDVFLDLADALRDAYPELGVAGGVDAKDAAYLADAKTTAEPVTAPDDSAFDLLEAMPGDVGEIDAPPGDPLSEPGHPATARMLEDLRRAGVLSDPELEHLKSQLDPGGSTRRVD